MARKKMSKILNVFRGVAAKASYFLESREIIIKKDHRIYRENFGVASRPSRPSRPLDVICASKPFDPVVGALSEKINDLTAELEAAGAEIGRLQQTVYRKGKQAIMLHYGATKRVAEIEALRGGLWEAWAAHNEMEARYRDAIASLNRHMAELANLRERIGVLESKNETLRANGHIADDRIKELDELRADAWDAWDGERADHRKTRALLKASERLRKELGGMMVGVRAGAADNERDRILEHLRGVTVNTIGARTRDVLGSVAAMISANQHRQDASPAPGEPEGEGLRIPPKEVINRVLMERSADLKRGGE